MYDYDLLLSPVTRGQRERSKNRKVAQYFLREKKLIKIQYIGFIPIIKRTTALGFIILPMDWHVDIFGQDYTSWRIYLLICSIPPVVGLVTATMLPESPKYLMAIGRSDAALKLLRKMYCMNTRQPADTFPVS